MPQVVELIPNRSLLDNDFDSYRYSSEIIPRYEKQLPNYVNVAMRSVDQFSFTHVNLFSRHNDLFINRHTSNIVYYVDRHWHIIQVTIGLMNRVSDIKIVGEIPKKRNGKNGDYPITIKFASRDKAVIVDGIEMLHVATLQKDKWEIISTHACEDATLLSALQVGSCLCYLVQKVTEPKFMPLLEFVVLNEQWQIVERKKILVPGLVLFAEIESQKFVTLVSDGEKSPVFLPEGDDAIRDLDPKFKWSQSSSDVTIIIEKLDASTDSIKVEYNDQENVRKLAVTKKNEIIIDGEFESSVTSVTHHIQGDKLVITAMKGNIGELWKNVIKGDNSGEQLQTNNDERKCFRGESEDGDGEKDENRAFYDEEEEVDAPGATILRRIDIENSVVTHETLPYINSFLFPVTIDCSKLQALCFNHASDACVWQFEIKENSSWQGSHVSTYNAFNYVLGSKIQKKFVVAPENLSYVVVADSFRHLFVFRQPSPVNGELRNRTTGRRVSTIAKQHVINLESNDEIVGIQATNTLLFVLTCKTLHVFTINEIN